MVASDKDFDEEEETSSSDVKKEDFAAAQDENAISSRELTLRLGPVTSEAFDAARAMLESAARPGVVVGSRFGLRVTEEMLSRLRPTGWLNDEIINYYVHLLRERAVPTSDWNVLIFETHFMAKLWENGTYKFENVVRYLFGDDYLCLQMLIVVFVRWTKDIDLSAVTTIICPLNVDNVHWSLIVVHISQRQIFYFDSLVGNGEVYTNAMKLYCQVYTIQLPYVCIMKTLIALLCIQYLNVSLSGSI